MISENAAMHDATLNHNSYALRGECTNPEAYFGYMEVRALTASTAVHGAHTFRQTYAGRDILP